MKLITLAGATLALIITCFGGGQKTKEHDVPKGSVTWSIDNLKRIGTNPLTIIGRPRIIDVPNGKGVLFDGAKDGLLVPANPIAGIGVFTVEAIFRPDPGGSEEQRWFHIQEERGDNRVLLETRSTGDQWFLDTFIKSGEHERTLYAEDFKHPLGRWYHVALVYDGSQMRHYVDGREELSGPLAVTPFAKGATSIGVRMNRVHWFKGAIRKARFTPRALAPKEFMANE